MQSYPLLGLATFTITRVLRYERVVLALSSFSLITNYGTTSGLLVISFAPTIATTARTLLAQKTGGLYATHE
jgi:hypothetical protein